MKFELQLFSPKTRFDIFVIVALNISLNSYTKPNKKVDTVLLGMSFDWDLDLKFFRLTLESGSKHWSSSTFIRNKYYDYLER